MSNGVDVSQEEFDSKLEEILSELGGRRLLSIPGIYEIVSEYFNNDVLDAVMSSKEEEKKERSFLVSWEIEIEATDPVDAAKQAMKIQQDKNSIATVFSVSDIEYQETVQVDLGDEEYQSDDEDEA